MEYIYIYNNIYIYIGCIADMLNCWKYTFSLCINNILQSRLLKIYNFLQKYWHCGTPDARREAGWRQPGASWLGLTGLPGRAGRAGPSESSRGAKNIEKPCKKCRDTWGTLCFPILFGPHERKIYIFPSQTLPGLLVTRPGTTTYISFSARTPKSKLCLGN